MPFSSEGAIESVETHDSTPRAYRYRVPSLVYVRLDQGNGGIVRDINADGIGIQAVGHLHAGQAVLTRFDLLNPRTHIEVPADVIWANDSGQAGLRFELSPRVRRTVNDWIITNLLATLHATTSPASMFGPNSWIREPALPSTTLASFQPVVNEDNSATISLPFWPRPLAMRTVWMMMDALLVMTAVLLFWLVFLVVARSFPPWNVTAALFGGITLIAAFGYRRLFRIFAIESPGCLLATRAAAQDTLEQIRGMDDSDRFR
ncbi:MAG TPA: PilZ domain-containing protein [Terriglobales bacterium]|jgi:PilZ domain|nr:PilZ domain-containing protein [Terriglobales bacterium]